MANQQPSMLSAFTPRPIVELKPKEKLKIESILAFGNRLLVGLSTGHLRVYRINEESSSQRQNGGEPEEREQERTGSPAPAGHTVELIREVEKFSNRAVQQLAIIKEANIVVALSDNLVSIYDLQEYTLQEKITRTKGATFFAVTSNIIKDPLTGIPSIVSRLAVAVKRKLLIWSWHDTELSADVIESSLTSPAKTLTWTGGTKIICGMGNGFLTFDIHTKVGSDIIGPGSIGGAAGQEGGRFGGVGSASMGYIGMGSWVPKPLVTRLMDGELLLAKDVNTLFVDSNGEAVNKQQIPWSVAPEAIAYSYPYLLALQPPSKGVLEVRNPNTRSLLQSIPLPNATQLHVPQPNVSLAHAGKGFLVASDRCIWRMGAEDYGSQIDQLAEKGQFDEAISLLGMLEDALIDDKDGRLREMRMQKAQALFVARKYRDSLDLFTDVSAPPEQVVKLYPRSIAGDLSAVDEDQDPDEAAEDAVNKDGQSGDTPAEDSSEVARRSQAAVSSGKSSLSGAQKTTNMVKLPSDTASIASITTGRKLASPTPASEAGSISDRQSINPPPTGKPLSGDDLHAAVSALCSFLADTRRRLQRYLSPEGTLKESLDTTNPGIDVLLLLSPSATPSDSVPSLDEEALHERLLKTAKLVDTTLFKSYTLTRPSLASSLFRISNFCDPEVVNDALLASHRYAELVDFLHGKKLHRQALELLRKFGTGEQAASEQLKGTRRTVAYLQSLGPKDIDLILDFAGWVLADAGDGGLEIFTADMENAEMLPRDKVVAFLKETDEGAKHGWERTYLEHVVGEWDDLTSVFHARLVTIYVNDLLHVSKGEQDEGEEQKEAKMAKLTSFLKSSSHYSTAKALNLIPRDDPLFYEARAIVLSKMGQHKQALEIYVFKLEDHAKAEEYCNHVYLTTPLPAPTSEDAQPQPSIYHTLLSLYLHPPSPYTPSLSPALSLLSRHGPRLPPSSTLELIPPTLPVQDLLSYFRGRIRAGNSRVISGKIEVGLRGSERVRAKVAVVLGDGREGGGPGGIGQQGRGRRVVVGEERVCGVCHRRLGGSALAVMPDNSVVHYGCVARGQLSGSSGGFGGRGSMPT